MRFILLVALCLALSLGLGAWSARWALDRSEEFGTEAVGPWVANPLAGSVEADPYSKARRARTGNLTLGIGEGVVFRASRDADGATLRLECNYALIGQTPPARVWTLAAFGTDGQLMQPGDGRPGWLISRNLMRTDDNSFVVGVGPVAQPGNWLSVSGSGDYVLTLTLYDTPASSSSGVGDLEMPRLTKGDCRNG